MTRLRNKTHRRPQRRDIRWSDNAEPQLKPKIKVIIKLENLRVISEITRMKLNFIRVLNF